MFKKLTLIACLTLGVAACSSDSSPSSTTGGTTGNGTTGGTTGNGTTGGGTTGNGTTGGGTTGGTTGGGTTGGTTTGGGTTGGTTTGGGTTGGGNPSGGSSGLWFGTTNFGEAVIVVDGAGNVHGLSANGAGSYETTFGNLGSAMERYFHRDSINPANATSFTLAGDLPSTTDPAQSDTVTYNGTVTNDGQQMDVVSDGGNFSLTYATANDVGNLSAADLAGNWVALTSFCEADCNVTLNVTFGADGAMSGSTQFNDGEGIPLTGTASAAADSTQYMNVSFTWNGLDRAGVIHRHRDGARLVLNSVGPDDPGNKSFSAFLTRQ